MSKQKRFNTKAFTSLYITLSGAVITITGLILYISPPGRIAHWEDWRFILLTKEQWQTLHTIFAFLFVVALAFHLYFNWSIFCSYLKTKVHVGLHMKREIGTAAALTLLIFSLTLVKSPPFSNVMALGRYLTDSWSTTQTEPPVPHAEELSLSEYVIVTSIDLTAAIDHLRDSGIVGSDSLVTMNELARLNGTSPREIGNILARIPGSTSISFGTRGAGTGFGRMTVSELCERDEIDLAVAIQRLTEAGITASRASNLRGLANEQGMTPIEVVEIIKGGK